MPDNEMKDDFLTPEEENLLKKWLRAVAVDEDPAFRRPDDEMIFRFLSGSADEKETSTVRQALIKSKSFRREVSDLAKEHHSIKHAIQSDQVPDLTKIEIPSIEVFRTKYGDTPWITDPDPEPGLLEKLKNLLATFVGSERHHIPASSKAPDYAQPVPHTSRTGTGVLQSNRRVLARTLQVALPVAAAASLALVFVLSDFGSDGSLRHLPYASSSQVGQVMESAFAKSTLRSGGVRRGGRFDNAFEAATGGFANFIVLKDDVYEFQAGAASDTVEGEQSVLLLDVRDKDSSSILRYSSEIQRDSAGRRNVQAWIITLPSRGLLSLDMTRDSMAVIWAPVSDNKGAVIFTYQIGDKFAATNPESFEVK